MENLILKKNLIISQPKSSQIKDNWLLTVVQFRTIKLSCIYDTMLFKAHNSISYYQQGVIFWSDDILVHEIESKPHKTS